MRVGSIEEMNMDGLAEYILWIKRVLHKHDWYYMEYEEWQKMGGFGTSTCVCAKCGERKNWCDT
jgi:hypothetical protein